MGLVVDSDRGGLTTLSLQTQYRTGERDPVAGFYVPCLSVSRTYSRAVGYFRSTIFLIVGNSVVNFASSGGRIRLVCSPSVTEKDAEAIAKGYIAQSDAVATAINRDLADLKAGEKTTYRYRVLATLIKVGALDIRLAYKPYSAGIYHEKIGIFEDADRQRVSFLGSANETWSAWHRDGNHESIEVFREWISEGEAERVASHAQHFERLWRGDVSGLETIYFPEAQRRQLLDFAFNDLDQIERQRLVDSPPRRKPLPHQLRAIEAWEAAGRKGIFEHATGSGKTFTALTVIRAHVGCGKPALILVPSQLLLEQWAEEIGEVVPEATLLLAGAGNDHWRYPERLKAMLGPLVSEPRIVLATMQTAATDSFLAGVPGGEHLLIVADEVHQIGSRFNARAMAIVSGSSLGLSATPIRFGDPDGTARIFRRFGDIVPPTITLQDAIAAGRLVDYEYHVHPVYLTEDESAEWKSQTEKIRSEVMRAGKDRLGERVLSDYVKLLLIVRSRIAKKAQDKPLLAAEILKSSYREGQHWLVYCEDSDQLSDVSSELNRIGIVPIEYHSSMVGDRKAAMDWFRTFGGVIVSIRCLDEGVDIPAVSHALILASSQNPRQFIQRRGRVLRQSPGKAIAVIHDAVVVPLNLQDDPEQESLLRSEFLRAIEFSDSAINRSAGAQLRAIAISLGIDPGGDADIGIEEVE